MGSGRTVRHSCTAKSHSRFTQATSGAGFRARVLLRIRDGEPDRFHVSDTDLVQQGEDAKIAPAPVRIGNAVVLSAIRDRWQLGRWSGFRDPDLVRRPFFARFDPQAVWYDQLEPLRAADIPFFIQPDDGWDEMPLYAIDATPQAVGAGA